MDNPIDTELISILDTSAFFLQYSFPGKMMTVPKVVQEIKDLRGKGRFEVLCSSGLVIVQPLKESVDIILQKSEISGDRPVLSETDIDLLALALEHSGTVYTDDFAIQNCAHHMNILISPLIQRKAERRSWKIRCSGCGKYYDEYPSDMHCQICGALVRRKNK